MNGVSGTYGTANKLRGYAKLLRPHQWIKNGFVLIGVLFGHQLHGPKLISALILLVAFCATASAVYTLNDLLDVESDRLHPKKRSRPIASGVIGRSEAFLIFTCLAGAGLGLSGYVGWTAMAMVAAYLTLNGFYSVWLKHIAILDVFCIAAGFMLRILAGTLGIGLNVSNWLLMCSMMVTLFLGFTKRRAELLMHEESNELAGTTRRVLKNYVAAQLDQYIGICATGTALSYGLYTVSPETIQLHGTPNLIYTVPFLLYGLFRYLYLLYGAGQGSDTARDLLVDRHLLVTVLLWAFSTAWILS
nr:decaprenyl-phosphate phosphoribosyltransferase [uncultured Cupriavidus sp.]